MDFTNFNETMKYFFDKLQVQEMGFNYDEKLNWLISVDSFEYTDENVPYFLVVKLRNNTGTVVIGFTDGVKFFEDSTLGQIIYEIIKWNRL